MHHPDLDPTTHTVEMSQIAELNAALGGPRRPTVTAAELELAAAGARGAVPGVLPATAVLRRICWDGPPEFPYVHGHFVVEGGDDEPDTELIVDLHTHALRALSHRLRLRHVWGTGSVSDLF